MEMEVDGQKKEIDMEPKMNILTEDMLRTWDRGGRSSFLKNFKVILQDYVTLHKKMGICNKTQELGEMRKFRAEKRRKGVQLRLCIRKVIVAFLNNQIRKEKITPLIQVICEKFPIVVPIVADVFYCLDHETAKHSSTQHRNLLKSIMSSVSWVNYTMVQHLDVDSLQELGIINDRKMFNTRFIRIKTKQFYKQQKYNLFREECEGFSKLVSELNQCITEVSVDYMIKVIQALIGRFNLDPNRVVDCILEAFENQLMPDFFIPLIENFKPTPSTVCEILTFKLSREPVEPSMYSVVAFLIQNEIVEFEEIYNILTPEDSVVQNDWEKELNEAKEYARKSMVVSINKENKEEAGDEPETFESKYHDNQKLCLCEAFLRIGDWKHALNIIKRMPSRCCASVSPISTELMKLLHYTLDPVYLSIHSLAKPYKPDPPLRKHPVTVKPIHTHEEIEHVLDMIFSLGPYIHKDPVLLCKLLRIMEDYLRKTNGKQTRLYFQFLSVIEEVVLPALCFSDANCCLSQQIWAVLYHYPYHMRFRAYYSWKGQELLLEHPSLLKRRVDLVKKIKHLMRRISKENVKQMGRVLGKLSHSMPGVVFDYILSQIQLFDNLISPVIDALKFLTSLSYDILVYCLLEAMSPSADSSSSGKFSVMLLPNRPRTKHDGSTISPWLQNLSAFSGAICKKYSLDLGPILQYVANQLKDKQSLDLLLLKEIVQRMSGIEAAEDMTSDQLDAMGGGDLLKGEAGYFGQVRTSKKSASRLREAVSTNDLAICLCILMAQQRHFIIYDDNQIPHVKLIGKLYDQCQDTLVQFGTFLTTTCTTEDYLKKIPNLRSLLEEYHVSPDMAFFLWRPIITNSIIAKYDKLRKSEKSYKNLSLTQKQSKYSLATKHILDPVIDIMKNFLPPRTWEDISPQFYVTFWSLNLYDLHVPVEAYAREIAKIKQVAQIATDNKELASSKRKKEQDRCAVLVEKLLDEEKRHKEHVDRVMSRLKEEKELWFASRSAKSAKNEAVTAFLQLCLFPRCIFTAPDALYCAHFVNTIHSLSTPNFSTLICYDRVFCDIIYIVTSCTENEANRYGLFLCALLGTVMKWHGNKEIFDKECASYPGFVTKFRAASTALNENSDHVDYENFRHVCHKWHYKITKCVIVCLESKEYIQIRNALIVLKRILPHYPKVYNLANAVERWIERVRVEEKEKRHDIFALATSYIGQLKSKWSSLIPEENFHHKPSTDKTKKSLVDKDKAKAVGTKDLKKKSVVSTPPRTSANNQTIAQVSSVVLPTIQSPTLVSLPKVSESTNNITTTNSGQPGNAQNTFRIPNGNASNDASYVVSSTLTRPSPTISPPSATKSSKSSLSPSIGSMGSPSSSSKSKRERVPGEGKKRRGTSASRRERSDEKAKEKDSPELQKSPTESSEKHNNHGNKSEGTHGSTGVRRSLETSTKSSSSAKRRKVENSTSSKKS